MEINAREIMGEGIEKAKGVMVALELSCWSTCIFYILILFHLWLWCYFLNCSLRFLTFSRWTYRQQSKKSVQRFRCFCITNPHCLHRLPGNLPSGLIRKLEGLSWQLDIYHGISIDWQVSRRYILEQNRISRHIIGGSCWLKKNSFEVVLQH